MRTGSFILAGAVAVAISGGALAETSAHAIGVTLLRSGPSTQDIILEHLPGNAAVSVATCSNGWCRVQVSGTGGYIWRAKLAFHSDAPAVETQTPPVKTHAPFYAAGYIAPSYDFPGYTPPALRASWHAPRDHAVQADRRDATSTDVLPRH